VGGGRKAYPASPAAAAPVHTLGGWFQKEGFATPSFCRFKGVWGKQAKRRLWRMKRACFEDAARLAALSGAGNRIAATVSNRNPPGFLFGGVGTLLFSKEKCPHNFF